MKRPVTLLVKARRLGWLAKFVIVSAGVLLLGLGLPGCGQDRQGKPSATAGDDQLGTRGVYLPKTEGSAEELASHLHELGHQYAHINESTPARARAALLSYTDAMSKTAEAILEQEGISPEIRDMASIAWLTSLKLRLDARPEELDQFLAAAKTIQEKYPKSPPAAMAAFLTIEAVGQEGDRLELDAEERFEIVSKAAIILAESDSPHPDTPKILAQFAPTAEQLGHPERAQALYQLLADRFGDQPEAAFARGNAQRLGLLGQPIEGFEGRGLDGDWITLEEFRGKVVLIDFWATWCVPCIQELPQLNALYEQLADKGLVVLGVSLDRDVNALRRHLESHHPTAWPQIAVAESPAFLGWPDEDAEEEAPPRESLPMAGESMSELEARFGVSLIPMKMLIDRDGKLVATNYALETILPDLQKLFPEENLEEFIPDAATSPEIVPSPVSTETQGSSE